MQKLIAFCLIAASVLSACEKRKGTLLPPRQPRAEGGTEMRARTAPPEAFAPADAQEAPPQEFNEEEKDSLHKVKQQALQRARQASPAEEDLDASKAAKLYERGRSLMAQGLSSDGLEYFLASCQIGFAEACHKFAWHEERTGNPANAFRFYRIACDNGLNKSCNNIGFHLEKQRKWDDALDYYARACLNQHTIGCDNLKRLRNERLQMH